ncbi:2-dehydro-3-deoxygalactonokinase [Paraglaciecola arctica]|uniref:2-dehydro-3-deoxygalactonokinase n=1 Tax=Paraglaciecola arctica TaxID=1128911 RepID=UPI001C0743A0|nr:2-dehydro-3-deoxygalactonokinase [Paraglaciecola arctica]MBU3005287.1 2-dehydro-3-deoxygalactonokinase [Paraglaciecola arctica]
MLASNTINHLIIDWGTTNFRAFAMSPENTLVDTLEKPIGLLKVPNGNFANALEQALTTWLDDYQNLPIYMAGMVGSLKGWVNVDYAPTPASANGIASKAHHFELPWGAKATIFPGVSHQYQEQHYDVMRGEEVQLLGLAQLIAKQDYAAVLPGTHAKHATVKGAKIVEFASYLTGEFYAMLINHSLMSKGLPENPEFCLQSFAKGVEASKDGILTNKIFLGWTHRLFKQLNLEQIPDFISGMLIGYELRNLHASSVYLIGGSNLCSRYEAAAKQLSISTETIAGNECYLTGMSLLIKEINYANS